MKHHSPHSREPSNKAPAFFCLILASALLLFGKAGGNDAVQKLLSSLAKNENFVCTVLAMETGTYPEKSYTPSVSAISAQTETQITETEPTSTEPVNASDIPRAETVYFSNQSGLTFDLQSMLDNPKRITANNDGPQVLIYHTHATEAYTPSGTDTYEPSSDSRTLDTNQNVVRVGEELCKVLEANGIQTVHLTDLFDYPSYNGSYNASLNSVSEALKKYPTVQMAIDIHRDAILEADGSKRKLTSEQNGQTAAQLMLVMGTNASGLEFDDWQDHLGYAVTLQAEIDAAYPGLMRNINLREQRFNLHLTPASMLLEVGTSGNTLEEAITGVKLFGECLSTWLTATT